MATLGTRIQEYRKQKGLSLADLARAAQVSPPYLSQLERGERETPSADVVYRVASALGVTMADLLEDEVPPVRDITKLPETLPDSLREFIEERGQTLELRPEDVHMLANIRYRGRQPSSADDWEDLLRFIRRAVK